MGTGEVGINLLDFGGDPVSFVDPIDHFLGFFAIKEARRKQTFCNVSRGLRTNRLDFGADPGIFCEFFNKNFWKGGAWSEEQSNSGDPDSLVTIAIPTDCSLE